MRPGTLQIARLKCTFHVKRLGSLVSRFQQGATMYCPSRVTSINNYLRRSLFAPFAALPAWIGSNRRIQKEIIDDFGIHSLRGLWISIILRAGHCESTVSSKLGLARHANSYNGTVEFRPAGLIVPCNTPRIVAKTVTQDFEFYLATVHFLPRRRNRRAAAQYLDSAAAGRAGSEQPQVAGTEPFRDGLGAQAFSRADPGAGGKPG